MALNQALKKALKCYQKNKSDATENKENLHTSYVFSLVVRTQPVFVSLVGAARVAKKKIVTRDAAYTASAKMGPASVSLDGMESIAPWKDVPKDAQTMEVARQTSKENGVAIVTKVGRGKIAR